MALNEMDDSDPGQPQASAEEPLVQDSGEPGRRAARYAGLDDPELLRVM
jgi:hypothetical protein